MSRRVEKQGRDVERERERERREKWSDGTGVLRKVCKELGVGNWELGNPKIGGGRSLKKFGFDSSNLQKTYVLIAGNCFPSFPLLLPMTAA